MGQEFHPSYIRSSRYNYTVDYFELRAQPGIDGSDGGGGYGVDIWYEDVFDELVYPVNPSNTVIIGGTTKRGTEKLRVIGSIDTSELIIGDSYIKETVDGLVFYDSVYNNEVSLTDIFTSFWTRNSTYGWLIPKNTTDSLLLGLSAGTLLKRLQIRSELSNGTSYFISGTNSSDVEKFSVNDQGNIYTAGSLYFSTSEYISKGTLYLDFTVENTSGLKIYKNKVEGPGTSFLLRPSNPYYSRMGSTGDGIGFPTSGEVAVYISNAISLNVSASQVSFPKGNWFYSGRNLLKVNTDNSIQLGNFVFNDSDVSFHMTPDISLWRDIAGNLMFEDEMAGPVSLTQLIGTDFTSDWIRSDVGVISPKITGDSLKLPSLSGTGNRLLAVTNNGTFIATSFTHNHDLTYEPVLGVPTVDGYVLSSTVAGVRSWVNMPDPYITSIVSDILSATTLEGVLSIVPWASVNKGAGRFYLGTTNPTNTNRLNFDGYFYATKLYIGGTEVVGGGVTPVDDILDWSTDKYTPYAAQGSGKFDSGIVNPVHGTVRLNYDGNLYAYEFITQQSTNIFTQIGPGNYFLMRDASQINVVFQPAVSDGAGAVAFTLCSQTNLTVSGSKLLSILNQNAEKFYINNNGDPFSTNWFQAGISVTDYSRVSTSQIFIIASSGAITDMNPTVGNGAGAIAYTLDTLNALSTAGAILLSIKNNGVDKFYIDKDGGIYSLGVLEYADNAAAVTAGLPIGKLYRTGDALKIVH